MTKIKKYIYFSLAVLIMVAIFPKTSFAATRLTPTHLYMWARQGNVMRLQQFQRYINLQNQNRDTALCIAQQRQDQRAYRLLLKFGASTRVACHDNNDPVCAVIAGEKTKIAPAAWWLLGIGAAAGAYALIHNGSKDDPTPTCPTGYDTQYQSAADCGTQGANGWSYTSSGSVNGKACGKCTPFQCTNYDSGHGVRSIIDCPKYNTLKESIDPTAIGYAGDQPCYKCTYTCKDDSYKTKSLCEANNIGYSCSSTTEKGITCWKPSGPINCPIGFSTQYQSVEDCGTQGASGWSYASSGTSGTQKCGKCTPFQCTKYDNGHGVSNVSQCPKYNTLKESVEPTAIGYAGDQPCYKCTYTCKSDSYTSKSQCESNNTGYSCSSTTENGITCWKPSGPVNCPVGFSTQYQSVTDCGSQGANGWSYTSSGTSGNQKCGKCTPFQCTKYDNGHGVSAVTQCPKYTTLKEAVDINAIGYAGETPCYRCTYTCKSDLYTSKSQCESDNNGYSCSSTTENGITCWAPNNPLNCPIGYSTSIQSVNDCSSTHPQGYTYTSSGTSGNLSCGKCTPKTCRSGYNYSSVTACGSQGANGWSWTQDTTTPYAGETACGICTPFQCTKYDSGHGVSNVTQCPKYNTLKEAVDTNAIGYAGEAPCYKCTYTCKSDLYTSKSECESDNNGYNCSSTTENGITCWAPGTPTSCPTGYSTNYQSVTDCGSQGANGWSYTSSGTSGNKKCGKCTPFQCTKYDSGHGVSNVTQCPKYTTLKEAVDTNAIGYAGEAPCYKCTYTCKSDLYTSKSECESDNTGYTCSSSTENNITCWAPNTPSSCPTGYSTSYQSVNDCSSTHPNGYTYTSSGTSGTKKCGKCTPKTCRSGYAYSSVTACGSQGANGWSWTQDSTTPYAGETACGSCTPFQCTKYDSGHGVSNVTQCPKYTTLKEAVDTNAIGYAGETPCYKCTYTCKSDLYTSKSECEGDNSGYTCSSTTENGITCWAPGTPSSCPTGYSTSYPSVTACGAQGANGWSYTSSGTSGGTNCGKCTALSCSRFDNGQLKGVTSVSECPSYTGMKAAATNAVGYTGDNVCYRCSYSCASDAFDSQAECTSGGYTCSSNTVGSLTCWYHVGTTSCATGYSTQYQSVTDCGSQGANGWSYTSSGSSNGLKCGKCTAFQCSKYDNGHGVSNVTQCPKYTTLKEAVDTNAIGYAGETPCYKCTYTCKSSYYTSQSECEQDNNGYSCASTTENGITCWAPGAASSCPTGYSISYPNVTSCGAQGANGWSYTSSGTSGGNTCGKCTALSCSRFDDGQLKGVTDVSQCPSKTGMKAAATNAVGYTGDETCYRCSYSCSSNYTDQDDCEWETDRVCASNTVGNLTCWYATNTPLSPTQKFILQNSQTINRTSSGSENVIGLATSSDMENSTDTMTGHSGEIIITHNSTGEATGIKATGNNKIYNRENASITIINNNGGTAKGIYLAESAKVANDGTITIIGDSGTVYGIYGEGSNTIINSENGIIDVSGTNAYGIYVKDGTDTYIKNAGVIYANGENAHGIYVDENSNNTTIVNTGEIYLNGTSAGDSGITLNGGSIRNSNLMSFSGNADLNTINAVFYLEDGGVYEAESLSGDLTAGTSNVLGGNRDVYINEGALRSENTENLNLFSESALFNAHIENNGDGSSNVVLERKDFAEFTPNSSIANYLEENYQAGNMEEMYNNIKMQNSQPNVSETIAQDLGYDVLPNFAQENYIALKSLNRNISDTVLTPTNEINRVIAGGDYMNIKTDNEGFLSGYELNSSSMYTFGDKRLDNRNRLGLGLSITHLNTNYERGGDRKLNIFNLFIPYMHKFTNNLNWASILSIGYGDGEYDRGSNKESDIQDIFYGWANELRYTMDLNGFAELEPALMLNALGYTEDGFDEGNSATSLISKKTHNMSVEAGIGLFLKKKISLCNYGKLGFKVGGVYYRELADQYDNIEAKNRGAIGWYKLNDYAHIYKDDRAVLEAGVDYDYKRISLYAKYNQLIERNDPKLIDLGLKYNF